MKLQQSNSLRHGIVDVSPDVSLHYLDTERGEQTVVLLHGFPETSHEWTRIVPRLARASLRVVAPDYRGAGSSSKPAAGYDKRTMASDIRALVRDHLSITSPIAIVGHDIGAMIGVIYALQHSDEVSHLVAVDTLLPGTAAFDRMRGDPRGWHAAFHSARDIAELLVQGRERAYLRHMIDTRVFDPSAISPDDFEIYVSAYEAAGAMRAAFELYRTFDEDAKHLRQALGDIGKLRTPVLAIGGERSGLGRTMAETLREVGQHVEAIIAPRTGHWIPEENPDFLADAVIGFLQLQRDAESGIGRQRVHAS